MTNTFTSKSNNHRNNHSTTRRIKKGWKKPFNSARRLKESPTIPDNYYQSDDDDDSWDGWSWDDDDASSYESWYPYHCICHDNEGHRAKNDEKRYNQQFRQRKQARRSCVRWNYEMNLCFDYDDNQCDDDCMDDGYYSEGSCEDSARYNYMLNLSKKLGCPLGMLLPSY